MITIMIKLKQVVVIKNYEISKGNSDKVKYK